MKSEKEENIKDPYKRTILISSTILFLLGVWALIANFSGVLALDFPSIIRGISALSLIIGAIGATKRSKWGLCFLGFSILFPIVVFLFRDSDALAPFLLFAIVILAIFIHLFMICQACHCKDKEKQERLECFAKKYLFYLIVIVVVIALIVVFNILACAFGGSRAVGSKASGITKIMGLSNVVDKVQEIGGINN